MLVLPMAFAESASQPIPPILQKLLGDQVEVVAHFPAQMGLTGYAVRIQGRLTAVYVSPDGQQLFLGQIVDTAGTNLTAQQLAAYTPQLDPKVVWKRLEQAAWVQEGPSNAKRVIYSFTDPNCPYCHKLWLQTQHYHDAGLQVRHVLVGVIKPNSLPKAAAILQAADPTKAFVEHQQHFDEGGITALANPDPKVVARIRQNNALMDDLGISGTPAVVYRDGEGKIQIMDGLPNDAEFAQRLGLAAAK
jgi:thiol:disulfide interchange protein DsbG